jgi:nucleotide-binding universal stress UspA family protein
VSEARQRIVVGIDGSDGARAALSWTLAEAARRGADVEVVAAFPVDFYWTDPYLVDGGRVSAIRTETEARARAMLAEVRQDPAVATAHGADAVDVEVLVVSGAAPAHLVQQSADAALLVVGSRGRGALRSTIAGSVALHCAAHAKCSVVVVHPSAAPVEEPARVVVGLDDSEPARAALAAAVTQAAGLDARVDAVVAFQLPDYWIDLYALMPPPVGETEQYARARGETMVAEVVGAQALEQGTVRVAAVEGYAAEELVRQAQGARLLVVGSRSRNQLEGVVLGSVALHCVLHAPCPVLVVRAPATRSPERSGQATAGALLTAG